MKRHGNLFDSITSVDNLHLAYRNARRGKAWQYTVKNFDRNAEENLTAIQQSLVQKTFKTSPYKTKIITEPKVREIYILPFAPDRIVQHALMNVIEPIWEGLFISDSYACRKGKGIHAGSRRTMEFVRQNKYVLQCDISKFYPSMDHDVLYELVQKKIKCKGTLSLLKNIIYSVPGDKNVPIGNYTSQWFGNLYLNEIDQLLKHQYKVKHYLRYCDDFCLFHDDKQFLNEMKLVIKDFAATKLKFRLSKCELFPVSDGVDFLGYRHFRNYVLLRKSTAKRISKRLQILSKLYEAGRITIDHIRASIASSQGWLKWANTKNLQVALQINTMTERYATA